MKRIFVLTLVLVFIAGNAQDFHGKATYFSKRIFKKGVEEVGVKSDDDEMLKNTYEDALKKASEKIFLLSFNKKEALYEEQEKLEVPSAKEGGVSVSIRFSGQGKKYINIQEGTKISEDDIIGKEFLIVETLQPFEWKLIEESKKIGEYTCFKAEVVIPVSDSEKEEYAACQKKQETKTSLFSMDEPKPKKITAWYTTDIPVSLGPVGYWGLPGLILEVRDDEMIILCSKVIVSNNATTTIKVPNTGKKVSQVEFDAIHKAKMESLEGGNGIFQTRD